MREGKAGPYPQAAQASLPVQVPKAKMPTGPRSVEKKEKNEKIEHDKIPLHNVRVSPVDTRTSQSPPRLCLRFALLPLDVLAIRPRQLSEQRAAAPRLRPSRGRHSQQRHSRSSPTHRSAAQPVTRRRSLSHHRINECMIRVRIQTFGAS
jgi:hypothetical protein